MTATEIIDNEKRALIEAKDKESKSKSSNLFTPELLSTYYSRLFPYELIFDWLNYDPGRNDQDKLFSNREFSFTIDIGGEEVYIRYQSYSKLPDFQDAILQRKPIKIDIGAVYSHPPKDHKTVSQGFTTVQRELVFDIDLTDYDSIRNCGCTGAIICKKCWKMMNMAIKVMDVGLREDFGFKHIAWFYSGRRGVHAWICDEKARTLSNEARSAVAAYFEINLGTDKNKNILLTSPLHPMMKRAFTILEPLFIEHIIPESGHSILAAEENWAVLLESIPDCAERVKENLKKKWKNSSLNPAEKWEELKQHLDVFITKTAGGGKTQKTMTSAEKHKLQTWTVETVFRYTYPRLDINVSKMQNHLLKSPFCVHPKTSRVCIPIQVDKVDAFDPFSVPTLSDLIDELNTAEKSGTTKVTHEWQKTSLKESFEPFIANFLEPLWKDIRKQKRDYAEASAAFNGEF